MLICMATSLSTYYVRTYNGTNKSRTIRCLNQEVNISLSGEILLSVPTESTLLSINFSVFDITEDKTNSTKKNKENIAKNRMNTRYRSHFRH